MRILAFVFVFVFGLGVARLAGAEAGDAHAEPALLEATTSEGVVTAVDPLAHRFVIVMEEGREETFRIDPGTIVLRGDRRLHDDRLSPGQRVRVHPRAGSAPRRAGVVEILALGQDPDSPPGSRAAEISSARDAAHGSVLVDAFGYPLYAFSGDELGENARAESRCLAECAERFEPVLTNGPPIAKGDVSSARLARFERAPAVYQVSYDGSPLYRHSADAPFTARAAGTIRSNGESAFGGVWRVVPAAGFAKGEAFAPKRKAP